MTRRRLVRELGRFGTVGASAMVVDVGLFNLLITAGLGPLTSKALAVTVATTWSYVASRCWAYRHRGAARDRIGTHGEYLLFFAINAIALGIALLPLAATYYGLGMRSVLAQNISTNGVGLVLGMAFRFWAYRTLVFPESAGTQSPPRSPSRRPATAQTLRRPSLGRPASHRRTVAARPRSTVRR